MPVRKSAKKTDDLLERGLEALDAGDARAALALLDEALAIDADDPDVRHAKALAHEDLDDQAAMIREFLQVRLLDAEGDRRVGLGTADELRFIDEIAADVLARLPEPFCSRLRGVPIVLEKRPSLHLVRGGFDPRAFGLFEGLHAFEDGVADAPSRIVIYTHNLLAEFHEAEDLEREIEITLLHEIGHYFGLDEDDMERLELD